jgi:hypothetical protein
MKLDDRKLREIERNVARLGRLRARVGVIGKQAVTQHGPSFTNAELAYVHEFGSPAAGVPQRSFLRSAFEGQRQEAEKLAARAARAVVTGKVSPEQAVGLLGEWGVARVREGMVRGIGPALAPATLEKRKRVQAGKRGRDVPLIDTGRLRQAVTYDVTGGTE